MRCWKESMESYYGVSDEFASSGEHLFYEIEEDDEDIIIDKLSELIAEGEIWNTKQVKTIDLYCDVINDDIEVEVNVGDYFTQEEIDKIIEETEEYYK